jgi:hypothetical protein
MKPMRNTLGVFVLMVCLWVVLMVSPVQAKEVKDAPGVEANVEANGKIQVSVQRSLHSRLPIHIVLYDKNWVAISEESSKGGVYTFTGLKTGLYNVLAYTDDAEAQSAKDVQVMGRQTTRLSLQLATAEVDVKAADSRAVSCGGTSADGRFIKVYPTFGQTIIYLQCGRVVARVEPAGCGCRGGNWRYINDCKKGPPIYVTLPCHRGTH